MSYNNVGKVWSTISFKDYLKTIKKPAFAKAVCIHHCGAPSLAQRPKGFIIQHLHNLKSYYSSQLGWRSGPHLFIDEDEIFGMTPLTETGVHAVSFNRNSIGIEVLGDYDTEDPLTGRGRKCFEVTARTTKLLLDWLGLPINSSTILFHRDDPKTSKSCPGKKVTKDWFINLVKNSVDVNIDTPIPVVFVKIVDYLVKLHGYSFEEAASKIKRVGNTFYVDGKWVESAKYDPILQSTVAVDIELKRIFG